MHGTDQDRARLLGRLAIGFGAAALLGGIAQIVLWLFGLIVSPNFVPAVIASVLLMSAIVAATYWLTGSGISSWRPTCFCTPPWPMLRC